MNNSNTIIKQNDLDTDLQEISIFLTNIETLVENEGAFYGEISTRLLMIKGYIFKAREALERLALNVAKEV